MSDDRSTSYPRSAEDLNKNAPAGNISRRWCAVARRSQALVSFAKPWYWEIGSAILSCISFSLMFGILSSFNGKSYTSWEYGVTPNTVVSLLVAIGKSTMMVLLAGCLSQLKWNHYCERRPLHHLQVFDEASRGPYGALSLILRTAPSLATVGATLTVLSFAIDPFAQQILAYRSRSVLNPQDGTAYAQKAKMLDGDVIIESVPYVPHRLNYTFQSSRFLPRSAKTAILTGLAEVNTPLEPVCPSGNCEYPGFVTIGFCSRCVDVTNDTERDCGRLVKTSLPTDPPIRNCTYNTPGVAGITPEVLSWISHFPTGLVSVSRFEWTSLPIAGYPHTERLAGVSQPLAGFGSVNYSGITPHIYTLENLENAEEPEPVMTECALYICEKEYERQQTSRTHPFLESSRSKQLFFDRNFDPDESVNWVYTSNETEASSSSSAYSVRQQLIEEIQQYLALMFTNYYSGDKDRSGDESLLYYSKNLTLTMEHLATSLTDWVRASETSTVQVPGQAFINETHIVVRWGWTIFPLFSVVLSTAFLVATILMPDTRQGILWKSSTLGLLLHDVKSPPEQEDLRLLRDVDKIHSLAKKIFVSIEENAGSQQLVFTAQAEDKGNELQREEISIKKG
ncbi:hypothetical protein FQN54_009201 [Arachnomyces sp. PD_36]|nr:hypothetical protein FQN54_009201 [Arachnomyces sp. PD_36]